MRQPLEDESNKRKVSRTPLVNLLVHQSRYLLIIDFIQEAYEYFYIHPEIT